MPSFYEFFAGGGMANAGLGPKWDCLLANDIDSMKADVYCANWGREHFLELDINLVEPADLPGKADLAWASFPCQDLSLAGNYQGIGHRSDLRQTRSGTFWPFWDLMTRLKNEDRGPPLIVLENVCGALTSNGGRDFVRISECLSVADYRFGALVIDAKHFLPQSRPRLFFLGISSHLCIPHETLSNAPISPWHSPALVKAQSLLSHQAKQNWAWWNLPCPPMMTTRFVDLIEDDPIGCD